MRVAMTTDEQGVRRPDLPDYASFTITMWHDDGKVTVELDERTELRMLIEEMKQ